MSPDELMAWTAGYLAGWDRGAELHEWPDFTDAVKTAMRRSEVAGRRKAWDEAVKSGGNPTPYTPGDGESA